MAVLHEAPPTLSAEALPTLAYALMALLSRERLSGYGLAQQLRDPIGLFWEAGHSQIYPQLARLEQAGLIIQATDVPPGPRAKVTYQITEPGLQALRAWIGQPTRRWGGRDELVLKVYASWVAEPSATLDLLREAADHHAAQLARYLRARRSPHARLAAGMPPTEPDFTDYATLRRGIGYERGRLAWCRWLIAKLEAVVIDPKPTPRGSVP
jgi:DNA-binding PadR family transcriptional regulator